MQQGAFTIHTSDRPLTELEGAEGFLRQFRIPAEAQRKMALDVELLGMRLGDVFPDSRISLPSCEPSTRRPSCAMWRHDLLSTRLTG